MSPSNFGLDIPLQAPTGLRCVIVEIGSAVVAVVTFPIDGVPEERLTSAERSVIRAVFEGKSNDAIARERGTSPRTVANQIASIFRKHGVASRGELVAQYLAGGTAS